MKRQDLDLREQWSSIEIKIEEQSGVMATIVTGSQEAPEGTKLNTKNEKGVNCFKCIDTLLDD